MAKDDMESYSLVRYFELLAYGGGLWYFITHFLFGPISKLIQRDVNFNKASFQVIDMKP